MSRLAPITAALLVLVASAAAAAPGVNLTWGAKCWKDGGTSNLDWACGTNTGTAAVLSLSFASAQDHGDFISASMDLEAMSESAGVPDWWRLATGECRGGSLTLVTDYTAVTTSCVDLWEGGGFGDMGEYLGDGNRVHAVALWVADYPIPITGNVEYACAMFVVDAAKTTGSGSCAGCSTPLVWGAYQVELGFAYGGSSEVLMDAIENQCVTWQHSSLGCGTVPVHNTTWGAVKSLYR